MNQDTERWRHLLRALYGDDMAIADRIASVIEPHRAGRSGRPDWSETDAWLITYPDQFQQPGSAPLETLAEVYATHLADTLNGIHILPFFPWSSDDGYAVTDYRSVDPRYGTWGDVAALARTARVMIDAVVNHMSAESEWFERWRTGDTEYSGFFRTASPDADLSKVVRARTHPLLTPVETVRGSEWAWTTFSPDQIDLDYRNPEVLARILQVLLEYAAHGISMIRLDAVCFLWKEESSSSIHLPQTHNVIQFLRACLDATYPQVGLVSETNVPHAENISYLGDGEASEAQAVYQFSLPPLVLHSYATGRADVLGAWIAQLAPPPPGTTFLNFLGSHDGVGLRPIEGILAPADVERLAQLARACGGRVNSRTLPGGVSSPYELNATWYDLIRGGCEGDDAIQRHLGSHAIMLAMQGVPVLYAQSLFAGNNDHDAVRSTGVARAINRRRFNPVTDLISELAEPSSRAAASLTGIKRMLALRRAHPAFHPSSALAVLDTPQEVLGLERRHENGASARVYVNVSDRSALVPDRGRLQLGERATDRDGKIDLGPWGMAWVMS
jgi:glycosidase